MCFIQERNLKLMIDGLSRSFRGNNNIRWTTKSAQGLSGSLVILWRNYALDPNFSFIGRVSSVLAQASNVSVVIFD